MNPMQRLKFTLACACMILFGITSCVTRKTIVNNYALVSDDACDCVTRHPLVVVGTRSNYFLKEKAVCLRADYSQRRDSVLLLENKRSRVEEQLEEEAFSADSLKTLLRIIDSDIQRLKYGWTHAKIKTKWKVSPGNEIVILKQRKVFYSKFKSGRKRVGVKVYKNDAS